MFADDTKMYYCIKNKEDEQKLLSNILQAWTWAAKWQMTFNVNKCKTMHLETKIASESFMKDNNKTMHKIQQVNQEKDLGVIFDNELKFEEHTKNKVNIANRNLGIIYRSFCI